MSLPSGLSARLAVLRRDIRLHALREALATLLYRFLGLVAAVALLDLLLRIDVRELRWLLVVGCVVVALDGFRRVRRHQVHSVISDADLARVYERRHPELSGRFVSAVEFAGRQGAVEAQVVAEAESMSSGLVDVRVIKGPLTRLERKTLAWIAGWLLALLLVPSFQVAAARLLLDIPYPMTNALDLSTFPSHAIRSEPFRVSLRCLPGMVCASETLIEISPPGEASRRLPMLETREGELFAEVSGLQADVSVRIIGGDFKSHVMELKVYDRPRVESLQTKGRHPAYMGREDREFPVHDRSFSFVKGGVLAMEAGANVPLKSATLSEGGRKHEGVIEGHRARFAVEVQAGGDWIMELVEEHGIPSRSGLTLRVEAVPDQSPQFGRIKPGRDMSVTPRALVAIEGQAQDDFGLERIELVVECVRSEGPGPVRTVTLDVMSGRSVTQRPWSRLMDFEKEKAVPGDLYKFQPRASDHLGQWGGGRQLTLAVVTPETLQEELSAELRELEKTLAELAATEQRVVELCEGLGAASGFVPAMLKEASETQQGLEPKIGSVRDKVTEIGERIQMNRLSAGEVGRVLTALDTGMTRLAEAEAPAALESLRRTRDGGDRKDPAVKSKTCLATLREMEKLLSGSKGLMEAVGQLEGLIRLQEGISQGAGKLKE